MTMERRSRCVILKNKEKLQDSISLPKIKPYLIEHRIFTKSMLEDIYDNGYNFYDELLTRGPDAFAKFIKVLKEAGYIEEASILDDVTKVSRGLCYKMYSKPLGYCLIINNVDFPPPDERFGSDVDAATLRNIFEKIGYEVLTERNCKGIQMETILKKFARDEKLRDVHSCIVVILSHGRSIDNTDVICGIDNEFIAKSKIYDWFSNTNCKNLRGKPKIFIFQACRGQDEDSGAKYRESADACKVETPREAPDASIMNIAKSSTLSDILVVHSALPHHKSYRTDKGSWLCQDLVQVLTDDYRNYDLETMLKSVTRKIQNRLTVVGKYKQGIHVEQINLRADIYFVKNNESEYFQI